ncbi:hypothetical protein DPMN_045079 [Dreissena polymorpha]|uniref:DZANK-type domain-containing protein n=1 Tax=Dreissena polymorpha TaxID=45954 RepID=A0A9D4HX10_DREPO|nr:hypothetical protein DPMN_045079 [Dreissena polymorpha]
MFCSKCKRDIEESSLYCCFCGTATTGQCNNCKRSIKSFYVYCPACGKSTSSQKHVCDSCGNEVDELGNCCPHCGSEKWKMENMTVEPEVDKPDSLLTCNQQVSGKIERFSTENKQPLNTCTAEAANEEDSCHSGTIVYQSYRIEHCIQYIQLGYNRLTD